MLALDEISGLAEEDRKLRKDTLRDIQQILDTVDGAKNRLARVQQGLATELEKSQLVTETPAQAKQSVSKPLESPTVDWQRVKLPVKFTAIERPHAYILSASLPGLDGEKFAINRKDRGVLSISGHKEPTAAERQQMNVALAQHVRGLPKRRQEELQQNDLEAMLMQIGHGRYGRFIEDFELPGDVDWTAIEPSYLDGMLRVLVPRRASGDFGLPPAAYPPRSARRGSYPGLGGLGGFLGAPHQYLW